MSIKKPHQNIILKLGDYKKDYIRYEQEWLYQKYGNVWVSGDTLKIIISTKENFGTHLVPPLSDT